MRERLVRIRHAVDVVALRDRGTLALVGGDDLLGELLERRPALLLADRLEEPADRQRLLPVAEKALSLGVPALALFPVIDKRK